MKRAVKLLLHGSFIMVPEFFHRCELIVAIALSLELDRTFGPGVVRLSDMLSELIKFNR